MNLKDKFDLPDFLFKQKAFKDWALMNGTQRAIPPLKPKVRKTPRSWQNSLGAYGNRI
jgi:hypothetical protein